MAAAATAFVVTFLVVCALGYLAFDWRGRNEAQSGTFRLPRLPLRMLLAAVVAVTAVGSLAVFAGDFVLRPGTMALLALIAIIVGVPMSKRVRQRDRFLTGLLLFSFALLTFWPMQSIAATPDLPYPEYKTVLHGLALLISVSLFAGGLETLRRAIR